MKTAPLHSESTFDFTAPLPFLRIPPAPVNPEWSCQHSGECCTKPAEVVMRKEEWATLQPHVPVGVEVRLRDVGDGFVAMKAAPCPLYLFGRCSVYEVRPYNCRRFACMRSNLSESYLPDARIETRPGRRLAQKIQRKAQRWALQHGWGK